MVAAFASVAPGVEVDIGWDIHDLDKGGPKAFAGLSRSDIFRVAGNPQFTQAEVSRDRKQKPAGAGRIAMATESAVHFVAEVATVESEPRVVADPELDVSHARVALRMHHRKVVGWGALKRGVAWNVFTELKPELAVLKIPVLCT